MKRQRTLFELKVIQQREGSNEGEAEDDDSELQSSSDDDTELHDESELHQKSTMVAGNTTIILYGVPPDIAQNKTQLPVQPMGDIHLSETDN